MKNSCLPNHTRDIEHFSLITIKMNLYNNWYELWNLDWILELILALLRLVNETGITICLDNTPIAFPILLIHVESESRVEYGFALFPCSWWRIRSSHHPSDHQLLQDLLLQHVPQPIAANNQIDPKTIYELKWSYLGT